ncbi:MAG: hypothetical protein J0L52_05290 [Caulobacterales bacterium]|nr:hypothetical protein [Caulobacterales bacterium]
MARAQFQKGQRVWVDALGAWATIERLIPIWAKGFPEPVRVTYDVGLGREFTAHELAAPEADPVVESAMGGWRLMRAENKWQIPAQVAHHPHPGTHPVVVTDPSGQGGWRVSGAEYDRDPQRLEFQARLIAASPELLNVAAQLVAAVDEAADDAPPEMLQLADLARTALKSVSEIPASAAAPRAAQRIEAA